MKLNLLGLLSLLFPLSTLTMKIAPLESVYPIHAAIRKQRLDKVKNAVEQGMTQEVYDFYGLVEYIDYGPKQSVNIPNSKMCTPLHVAARRNLIQIVSYLVDAGADLKARDAQKRTPLQVAAAYGRVRIVGLLKSLNARNVLTPERKTLVHLAAVARCGDPVATIQFLAKCGMKVTKQDVSGKTPLHDALSAQATQKVIYTLIGLGADLDIKDNDGITPRMLLAKNL